MRPASSCENSDLTGLRKLFASHGVDMSENSEDDEMLTALMSKFKGKPQELERAVRSRTALNNITLALKISHHCVLR